MAQRTIRVLLRWKLGFPWRQTSEEDQARANEEVGRIAKKWQDAGIKQIGDWHGDLDGFAHYAIFEVDDIAAVQEMNEDIWNSEWSKYVQDHGFHIGWGFQGQEDDG